MTEDRRKRKCFSLPQSTSELVAKLSKQYKLSESEVINQLVLKYSAENGLTVRPRNEGGIFQTKNGDILSSPASETHRDMPTINDVFEAAPIFRDERFTYEDILDIKHLLYRIKETLNHTDDTVSVMLNEDNSLLHYLGANTDYISAANQPHEFIKEGRAELAEEKRKAQIKKATTK